MDFGGAQTDLLVRLMSAASMRSRVIASNLANQNTPGYQRQVVRFEELLAEELRGVPAAERDGPRTLERLAAVAPRVELDLAAEASPDGNTVHLESEMNAMRENRLMYELYATMLAARDELIEIAITQR